VNECRFDYLLMRFLLALTVMLLVLNGCASRQPDATHLEKANVLPLALDDRFQFRKEILYFYGPESLEDVGTESEPVLFQRRRMEWGTVNAFERRQRYGNYYTFFWRATERADVTVRLEYRQGGLGNYVVAQELYYPDARGSFRSKFEVTGDEFLEFGRVSSWRALLIVEGKIVALTQSFIWQ